MKPITSIVVALIASNAFASAKFHPTYSRLMTWTAGHKIDWRSCSSRDAEITSAFVRHPAGDEADPPESTLELGVHDKIDGSRATYGITVAQALRRGYSLEGLRFRLTDKGWDSILAIKTEGGRLVDFVLMPTCDLPLVEKARASGPTSPR